MATSHAMKNEAQEVLDFWFGPPEDPGHGQSRPAWFRKDPAFDALIQQRFGALVQQALDGGLASWSDADVSPDPRTALALILVLDQFTRNVARAAGQVPAAAFAGDRQALALARSLVDSGRHLNLNGVQRQFAYLPFEHAEDMTMQRESVALFGQLANDEPTLADLQMWAQRHFDIVQRFGRFPHRNAALGRASTPEEAAFLQTPGSGF